MEEDEGLDGTGERKEMMDMMKEKWRAMKNRRVQEWRRLNE